VTYFCWPANASLLLIPVVLLFEISELAFSRNFCLRDVAWIRLAYVSTKRGDVGATSRTVLARQDPLIKQSKHRFVSLQHQP
jgi:hypothetical protein